MLKTLGTNRAADGCYGTPIGIQGVPYHADERLFGALVEEKGANGIMAEPLAFGSGGEKAACDRHPITEKFLCSLRGFGGIVRFDRLVSEHLPIGV